MTKRVYCITGIVAVCVAGFYIAIYFANEPIISERQSSHKPPLLEWQPKVWIGDSPRPSNPSSTGAPAHPVLPQEVRSEALRSHQPPHINGSKAANDVLALADSVVQMLRLFPSTRPSSCPNRYLFVNTHTFGRHHNQIQEFMNIVAWAKTLNRTAVIGYFRHSHKWIDPNELYDFSGIYASYCAIPATAFGEEWRRLADAKTAVCLGQGTMDTPLKRYVRKCHMVPGIPAYYDARYGATTTLTFASLLWEKKELRDATFVGLGGEIAFFLRPGLVEMAALVSRIRPTKIIADEILAFQKKQSLISSLSSEDRDGVERGYFGIHLRQREKECMKEVMNSFADGAARLQSLSSEQKSAIETQCALTVTYVEKVMATTKAKKETKLFLASDHENRVLEENLVTRGAVMYTSGKFHTKEHDGLQGLAVDFFMLQESQFFTGNQLSSISQNCCYARLAKGLECHGFVVPFALYHSQCLAQNVFVPNVRS